MTRCVGWNRSLGEALGFGGPKVVQCKRDADTAVKMGTQAKYTINGYRPLCWICARGYSDYKCLPINEVELEESNQSSVCMTCGGDCGQC